MPHVIHLPSQILYHAEHAVSENPESVIYFIYHCKNSFYSNFQVPTSPSRAIATDPFPRNFTNINTYFYVLHQYSTYSQRWGSVGYPHHDSIQFHARFHRENIKRYSQDIFPPKFFPLFFYTAYLEFPNSEPPLYPKIAFQDNSPF